MNDDSKTVDENTQTQTNSGNENTSTQTDGNVSMSQADFDALMGKKMAKASDKAKQELLQELGVENADQLKSLVEAKKEQEEANKTELQKLTEQLEAERLEKEKLSNELQTTSKKAKINSLAAQHGIKELDYFELELSKAQNAEDFNETEFIASLKESKPFVFGQTVKTDTTTNQKGNQPSTLQDKVAGITSIKELQALQKTL